MSSLAGLEAAPYPGQPTRQRGRRRSRPQSGRLTAVEERRCGRGNTVDVSPLLLLKLGVATDALAGVLLAYHRAIASAARKKSMIERWRGFPGGRDKFPEARHGSRRSAILTMPWDGAAVTSPAGCGGWREKSFGLRDQCTPRLSVRWFPQSELFMSLPGGA